MINKNRLMVFLLCLNAILLTAVVGSQVGLPEAQAQIRSNDYILIPGLCKSDEHCVWVIDLSANRIVNGVYNKSRKEVQFGESVDMTEFFEDDVQNDDNNRRRR